MDRPSWRQLLGLHVWFVTRPMFAVIAFGWHIVVPLAPFALDPDLAEYFPGTLVADRTLEANRRKTRRRARTEDDEISLSESVSSPRAGNSAASTMRAEDAKTGGKITFVASVHSDIESKEQNPPQIPFQSSSFA